MKLKFKTKDFQTAAGEALKNNTSLSNAHCILQDSD